MSKSRRFINLIHPLSVVLLLGVALLLPCLAQEPDRRAQRPRQVFPRNEEPADVLKIETDLVSLDVVATDIEGRPMRNLRQENFKLYLDDIEQPLSFFQVERRSGQPRPLAVVFALDISGSMTADEMERLRSAL